MSNERRGTSEGGGYRPKRQRKSGWDVQEPLPAADPTILAQIVQKPTYAPSAQNNAQKAGNRIYVGSIHYDMRESDIVALFSAFGPVTKSEMTMDPMTGRSKGFCFIEYADAETAQAAMAMDGFELAGRRLKVGRPFHGQGGGMGQNGASLSLAMSMGMAMTGNQNPAAPVNPLMSGLPLLGANSGGGSGSGLSKTNSSGQLLLPSSVGSTSSSSSAFGSIMCCLLVKNVDSEVPLNELAAIFEAFGEVRRCKYVDKDRLPDLRKYTKAALVEYTSAAVASTTASAMNKFVLAGEELQVEVVSLDRLNQLLTVDDSSFTRVLLRDMVTLEDAEDPDLKEEIMEEANQYGRCENVVIEVKDLPGGKQEVVVELKYRDAVDSHKAHKALNGRAFAGKKINAVLAP